MNAQEKVVSTNNKYRTGEKVIYWPILLKNNKFLRENGKRTKIESPAFISVDGLPVVFVEGVQVAVHVDNIESAVGDTTYCEEFAHKW